MKASGVGRAPEVGAKGAVRSSNAAQTDLEKIIPVRTLAQGIPVYGYGDTFIYGVSPDFLPGRQLQRGNDAPREKIRPKKSWEIGSNKFGATPPRLPRTAAMDFQPLLPINLVDGDPETYWCSRGQSQPTVETEWVRIDLPRETRVRAVVLVPRKDGQGQPRELTLQVSRDAWHWETVYENRNCPPLAPGETRICDFAARPAKQIRILARDLPKVENYGFCFSLAEVEIMDESGENAALVSRGAGVTVSSIHTGYSTERVLHHFLWPTHYDMGLKWIRVAYWDSVLQWHFVEQEKGKYVIDPVADRAITESARSGLNVILCLCYGNWLYSPEGARKRAKETWVIPYDVPPLPTTSAQYLEAFCNFARFMVRHFCDRVRYFEIWNEENAAPNYGFGDPKEYSRFVKAVAPVLRAEDAEAKIVLGSTGGFARDFLTTCLEEGVGPLVDVIGWHPFYHEDPESPGFRNYVQEVNEFKRFCESRGFKGEYMASEWTWSAPYPAAHPDLGAPGSPLVISELTKAKYLARLMITHAYLGMPSFWNETWAGYAAQWSIGLFRWTSTAHPLQTQPEPAYYVLRTLSTSFDGLAPAPSVAVEFGCKEQEFEAFAFQREGEVVAAIWVPGRGGDDFAAVESDVILRGLRAAQVLGVDTLNGFGQPLRASPEGDDTVLKGMLIPDYPILVRLQGVERH